MNTQRIAILNRMPTADLLERQARLELKRKQAAPCERDVIANISRLIEEVLHVLANR